MAGSTDKPAETPPAISEDAAGDPVLPPGPPTESGGDVRPSARRNTMQRLAHELKTPISAIVAAAEIMRDERFGPLGDQRYRTYAADIHESARLMLGVIDRMMENRALDPAQWPLDFAEIDVVALIAATVSTLLPLAERAGVTVTLDQDPRLPHLIADATSLKQILVNLLSNALKFTPRDGMITVKSRYSEDGPMTIEIADTGCGMSEAVIDAALRGERPPGSMRPGQGLGLGLPLVKALAGANGARIEIRSEPGAGTRVHVIFGKDRLLPV
ncbi:MAG: HAMP domain-containing sensor histidine kinase [Hyphomicrobiaceae bacterium]|nr:HAMP domain-containing sensor histidine kinase [Hyphomicrobiaceae bacterium]